MSKGTWPNSSSMTRSARPMSRSVVSSVPSRLALPSWRTSSAVRWNRTPSPMSIAFMPSPIARCVFPRPVLP